MSKSEEIKRLWSESFGDSPEYVDMYFDRIYRDADALTIADGAGAHIVSSLLLQPYTLWYQQQVLHMSYIAGAATKRNMRGRGFMSSLMKDALRVAYERGDAFCALIPAYDWLYFFYDQFGFSTVFYADVQRFTALHSFPTEHNYFVVEDPYSDEMYAAFSRFEHERKGTVLHSSRDFLNILDDLALDPGGTFIAVGRKDCGISAMAWSALTDSGMVKVKEVFGIDADAVTGALHELRKRFPEKPFMVNAPAGDQGHRHLYARGMGRIINVGKLLEAIAAAHPDWKCTLKVTDHILEENNHIYVAEKGSVRVDDLRSGPFDFDVTIPVLNNLLFSSASVGSITGIPSERIHMSLMLD